MTGIDRTVRMVIPNVIFITAAAVLLSCFPLTAADGTMKLNMWIEPAAPSGAWKYSGEAFPAERIISAAAGAGVTDMDVCLNNSGGIFYYDSAVGPGKRDPGVPADALDRLFAAAGKHGIRCWLVLTPPVKTRLPDNSLVLTSSDPRSTAHWRSVVAELGERFKKRYPEVVAGIVLHEINRPEAGNSHSGEIAEFSDFCQRSFGEPFRGKAMPDGQDGTLWNRRFNLYRIDCLSRWSRALAEEAEKYGMKTNFILYPPESFRSFSAAWGYDTLFFEDLCGHIWSSDYPTLKGMYAKVGISYRGSNVAQEVAMAFSEYPKAFFEMRSAFYPGIVRKFYGTNRKFTDLNGDFYTGYFRKSASVMELFFGQEKMTRWLKEVLRWQGAEPLTRIGVLASSLPNVLRHPVNPGGEYDRCVNELYHAVTRRYPAVKVLAGSLLTRDPVALRKRFDLLILAENQGIGLSRETVEALKEYVKLGGKLIGVASPVTVAKRDLTGEKDVTSELFGITPTRSGMPGFVRVNGKKYWSNGISRVSGTPKPGTCFIPVSYSAKSEKMFLDAVSGMLPEQRILLTKNNGFILHNVCEKNGIVCVSLPAEKPSKARLHCRMPDGDHEVRNLLTGECIISCSAAKLAEGIEIETVYRSEPCAIGIGPREKMKDFRGIYPNRQVFAKLEDFSGATIQNPEVPLLIPGRPGVKVGIWMSGLGAEKILNSLLADKRLNPYLIPRLDGECCGACDIIVVPQPLNHFFYRDGRTELRKALTAGKGIIICHSALRSAHEDFPEIFSSRAIKHVQPGDPKLVSYDGKEFLPCFRYDHYDCSFTKDVHILATDGNGRPVIGIGRLGKGFLGVFGTLPGHFGDSPNGSPVGDFQGEERQLLLTMIQIMRGGK